MLETWYRDHEAEIIADYRQFLSYPSISTDPQHTEDLERAAAWVVAYLKTIGFEVQLWRESSAPVVFAERIEDPSYPTLLIYHHYDVQPVDPLEQWKTPPFEPTLKEGVMYARGASDNKGQCSATLAALKAVLKTQAPLKLNLKLLIEGEEESGSTGAFRLLTPKQQQLKAEMLLVVDMSTPSPTTPSITLGLRGIMTCEVRCTTANIDLHSGIYGGIARNPNQVLIELLAELWDDKGRIVVPGFYDGIVPLSSEDRSQLDRSVNGAWLRKLWGLRGVRACSEEELWEAVTVQPTLEINGISGGYAGAGFKTVIPREARAKISARLALGQDPHHVATCIENFLRQRLPHEVGFEFIFDHGGRAVRASPHTPLANICARAYTEVFGAPCQKVLCGASVPLIASLAEVTGGDVVMIGVALDADSIHAPNEQFTLEQLRKAFLTVGRIVSGFR